MTMFKKAFGAKKSSAKQPHDNSLHTAVCSGCSQECQVPFKPNGKKPVFCSMCYIREDKPVKSGQGSDFYQKSSGYQSRPHARPDSRATSGGMTSDQFKILNAKLDTLLKLIQGDE